MKQCRNCERMLENDQFHRDRDHADGLGSYCRDCKSRQMAAYYLRRQKERVEYARAYHVTHREEIVEKKADWAKRNPESYRAIKRRLTSRQREQHPDRYRAKDAVAIAIRSGKIVKRPCEQCGAPKVDAHHYLGYAREHWLDIQWLCRRCHAAAHHY